MIVKRNIKKELDLFPEEKYLKITNIEKLKYATSIMIARYYRGLIGKYLIDHIGRISASDESEYITVLTANEVESLFKEKQAEFYKLRTDYVAPEVKVIPKRKKLSI